MFVKEIMTDKIVSVDSNETIKNACDIYRDKKVGCLIVTEKDDIVGIITERDFIERTICNDKDAKTTIVKDIMTSEIKTINADDRVSQALDKIQQYKIKKLPVVDKNQLVGIITITDIAYSRSRNNIRNMIRED